MKRILVFAALLALAVVGCDGLPHTPTDQIDQKNQEKLQAESQRQIGMPKIANFSEKRLLATIYELRDQAALPTWTYIVDLAGKRHLLCRSLGYGIPYATQFSNPQKIVYPQALDRPMAFPQAEPNGLFMPASAEATWIIMVTPAGPKPIYVEPKVIVSPVELSPE
jgi:hypothetical protein